MARNRESKIELTAYDDLFETDESRAEANLSKIREIPISEIDEFPDHPFKVLMDEDMEQLVDSVRRSGVMTPATVRQKEDGRYELISGHRRKKACELAGLETLKCEVKELTHDEAIIVMVESNLQRSVILPNKMRLEAMNRQGERTDLTCSPMGNKLQGKKSSDELAEKVGESKNQIFRYIRLTELVPEILQMVDERQIAFRPAVEISYLSEEQQYTLLEAMGYNDATPSLAQAIKMKNPQEIKDYEERITVYGNDAEIASQHKPQGEDKFCPMTLNGVTYKEKADAGGMLLAICKENPLSNPVEIGSYRGFQMEVYYDTVNAHYCLNLCGMRKYKVDLGMDALGNLTRIENEIAKLPARLEAAKTRKEETITQLKTAKEEIKKPFAFENELKEKTERLNALNIELNLNEKDNAVIDDEPEQNGEPAEKKSADRER